MDGGCTVHCLVYLLTCTSKLNIALVSGELKSQNLDFKLNFSKKKV